MFLPECFHLPVSGYGSGGINAANMQGVLSGVRGPFTPSQWMELEHQALIYKYIIANVPIPSYLLNPIRNALESAGFSSFSGLRPNACEFLFYFNMLSFLPVRVTDCSHVCKTESYFYQY